MEPKNQHVDAANAQQPEAWHALDADATITHFDTPPDSGLSSQEAAKRIEFYGPNQLDEAPPTTIWQMLWEQFNNFVVILLIVAAVISALLGDYVDQIHADACPHRAARRSEPSWPVSFRGPRLVRACGVCCNCACGGDQWRAPLPENLPRHGGFFPGQLGAGYSRRPSVPRASSESPYR